MHSSILPIEFYQQPTLELAKNLLGKLLVHETSEGITSGYIVEVEAYIGPGDKAAHSYANRRTARTEVMYGPPGISYVYQIYGMHYCVNVVSGQQNAPEAVLLRALEPVDGISLMVKRRGITPNASDDSTQISEESSKLLSPQKQKLLTNGPGKLAQALDITKKQNGIAFYDSLLSIHQGLQVSAAQIESGPRIGIDYAEEAKEYPWRFWIGGNPFVSKP